MADFGELGIPVYTPNAMWNIDLSKLSNDMNGPVGVIADVEGTIVEWGRKRVDRQLVDWAENGFESGTLAVIGLATNRSIGAETMCSVVSYQLGGLREPTRILHEHPSLFNRGRRKPAGHLSSDIMTAALSRTKNTPNGFVIVGDKPSDMFEADAANEMSACGETSSLARVSLGFMVEKYGSEDHPLDKRRFMGMPSVRDRATAFREQAQEARPRQPYNKVG